MEGIAAFAVNVLAYGAVGDGVMLNTDALQAAIDHCAAQGGGTVWIPAGRYLTGALTLRSYITLFLDAGSTLLGSEDTDDYPIQEERWEGKAQPAHAPLIGGNGLTHIAVVGRGTIDGQGAMWWRRFQAQSLAHPRPRLIAFTDCQQVLLDGITLLNSPSWTVNPVRCQTVTIQNLTIRNPAHAPNTDGINPDACRDVHIANCSISVGDDCITLKSGIESEALAQRLPCENITITNCTMADGHGGVVIGSEMSGDVRNVTISNCIFVGTDRGIRLKSRRGRGGVVEDIRVSNIVMSDVLCPLTMNLYYACGRWGDESIADKAPHPVTEATPRFRRIHISHISARRVKLAAAFLYGLAEMPIEEVTLDDVSISMAAGATPDFPEMADDIERMSQAGVFVRNVRGLRLNHVSVRDHQGIAFDIGATTRLELRGGVIQDLPTDSPYIRLQNVAEAVIHDCYLYEPLACFIEVEGANNHAIRLVGNELEQVQQLLQTQDLG